MLEWNILVAVDPHASRSGAGKRQIGGPLRGAPNDVTNEIVQADGRLAGRARRTSDTPHIFEVGSHLDIDARSIPVTVKPPTAGHSTLISSTGDDTCLSSLSRPRPSAIMRRNEPARDPMLLRYWQTVGGTLAEEFPAVRGGNGNVPRAQ
jgi:hypothetical protein